MQTTGPLPRPVAGAAATRIRYRVLVMAVLLASITYLDRVCISVFAPAIRRDLELSAVEMSFVFSAFTLAYGIFEIPTGWWGDRVGTRRVLARIVAWWSTFTILTGAAVNYASLLLTRFLFGVGEAGAWPNVASTFSKWFPVSERGRAQGIFFMGAHLAAGLTPILVTVLSTWFSWRALFAVFGSIGFVWAFSWYRWFRDTPAEHASVNDAERMHIESGRVISHAHRAGQTPWRKIFSNRTVLFLCMMYFTQTYGFYLFITWMPTYLNESRGFSSVQLGLVAGLPMTLSAVADVLGGFTTDTMTRRFGLRIGRCLVGGGSLTLAGLFMISGTFVANPIAAALLISLAAAFSNFLLGAAWATVLDIAGPEAGLIGACMNTSGQIGGFLSPIVVGSAVQYFSNWNAPLYITGILYVLGGLCWFGIDPRKPISLN